MFTTLERNVKCLLSDFCSLALFYLREFVDGAYSVPL